jgi:acetylornithine deacetylase
MTIDPFDPRREGDRLYGRGSCDTKAGLAALLAALERVLPRGTLRRDVIVVGEADEELGSQGVRDVLDSLGTRRPDWVLATEPTSLRIITHHKGIVIARLEASGSACHASNPSAGRSAITALARAVLALETLSVELGARIDPRLGPATLSVGQMGGGQAPNIVPNEAWLVLDRRLLPGENERTVCDEIRATLDRAGLEEVAIVSCRTEKGALGTPDDAPCVAHCRAALGAIERPAEIGGVAFGTDAGVFEQAGLPGVVMGPGSIERAHTAAEYVELDELEAMTDFFEALLEGSAGPTR